LDLAYCITILGISIKLACDLADVTYAIDNNKSEKNSVNNPQAFIPHITMLWGSGMVLKLKLMNHTKLLNFN
jgi:hypothetical protein